MLKAARLFSAFLVLGLAGSITGFPAFAKEAVAEYKKNDTSLSRDIFDQGVYYEFTNYLRLDRLGRKIFGTKKSAKNVNVYDEVPDSSFFTNRHARKSLTAEELERGYEEKGGPDVSGDLVITRGKFEGLNPGFFVKDKRGDEYLLKFDPPDNVELNTSTEVIASRFYYAIGYNVPENTILVFESEKLKAGEGAKVVDSTGFKKSLTKDNLEEYILFVPWDENGKFRASASKILAGTKLGGMRFQGRRSQNPEDQISHEDRREIRALHVFASWLNNYDVRNHNSLEMFADGKIKHYLIDFNSSFGGAAGGTKPPMFTHEYMFDTGETLKAYFGLGLWEKPWQKRWREGGEKVESPVVGYFDNRGFDPAKFKTQLPYYAFKDLTRADGFWAAKIIMSFSDEDIRAMVKAGKYSHQEDADKIAAILSERRDIVGRYWFGQAAPLDHFQARSGELAFEDLAVKYRFLDSAKASYQVDVYQDKNGKPGKKSASFKQGQGPVKIDSQWFGGDKAHLFIRSIHEGGKLSPYVHVTMTQALVTGIRHED